MVEKATPTLAKLEEIASAIPTPFHLYDEGRIRRAARLLKRAFAWNDGYCEYFAVKATPNPAILTLLKQEGCGLDCSSLTELMLAQAVGATGEDIMFSSNETPPEEFELARKLNAIINLDDITHIDFLKKHGGIPEQICLRYNPGGDFAVGKNVMGTPQDAKYGFTRPQLTEGIRKLQALGVRRFGLHAFLASNVIDDAYYPEIARQLFEVAAELRRETGAHFFMVNLSGGIGIPYAPGDREPDLMAIGEGVRRAYEQIIVPAGMHPLAVVSELGRYVTGPGGWLVARAMHEKRIYKHYIGLDACSVNLMRPAMYGAYHHISIPGKEGRPADRQYDIVGSLCENNDKFAVDRMLPEIAIGDLVVIHDTGAHGFSMGYNYNGKLRSAEVLLREDGTFKRIRRAETPEDYFATLDFSDVQP
ncbi:MAG: diaminopimelate decarboxylase [Clostridiales bacterium]|nr:diaminopimelate decarboxylase [Clostridiales bacterium]